MSNAAISRFVDGPLTSFLSTVIASAKVAVTTVVPEIVREHDWSPFSVQPLHVESTAPFAPVGTSLIWSPLWT